MNVGSDSPLQSQEKVTGASFQIRTKNHAYGGTNFSGFVWSTEIYEERRFRGDREQIKGRLSQCWYFKKSCRLGCLRSRTPALKNLVAIISINSSSDCYVLGIEYAPVNVYIHEVDFSFSGTRS
ncbi:hypothetical protein BaRGS_00011516 [Batillaria attramentaria]|uniref:Uncharacterized protein n=1 Tax=Batillaria attramentaria TaxID=370345 RepID=A0ABD0LCB7_9CAEN